MFVGTFHCSLSWRAMWKELLYWDRLKALHVMTLRKKTRKQGRSANLRDRRRSESSAAVESGRVRKYDAHLSCANARSAPLFLSKSNSEKSCTISIILLRRGDPWSSRQTGVYMKIQSDTGHSRAMCYKCPALCGNSSIMEWQSIFQDVSIKFIT
jgi:hypothetical protein